MDWQEFSGITSSQKKDEVTGGDLFIKDRVSSLPEVEEAGGVADYRAKDLSRGRIMNRVPGVK